MARVKPKTSPAIEVMLERIETLEQLAVGTAHEIKNPLAVIKGYMQVLQFDQGISQEIRQRIERLLRQVDQISRIADDLAGLAKLSAIDISMISISDLLEEVLDVIKPQAVSKGISIVRRYPDDIPEICGDAGKLEQAFLNICRNAVEAMGTKGDELRVTIRISSDRRNMEVEFRDTGPGISREAMTMMFTPFFTTKRHGTGLGLNISMHIARLHGGTIRAESVQGGKGAIFTVILPLARNSHLR
jgi:signal transduction histidine kinase